MVLLIYRCVHTLVFLTFSPKLIDMCFLLLLLLQLPLLVLPLPVETETRVSIVTTQQDAPLYHGEDTAHHAASSQHRRPQGTAAEDKQISTAEELPDVGGVIEPRGVDLSWYLTFLSRSNYMLGILNRILGVVQSIMV